MQNLPNQSFCIRCKAALQLNQPFCSNCGIQQPRLNAAPLVKRKGLFGWGETTTILVGTIVGGCVLFGLIALMVKPEEKQQTSATNTASTPTATPKPIIKTSPTPQPIGSLDERLQVAADVRRYLRDQDIPALVIASGTTLSVTYTYALMDYDPDISFMRQQGKQGLKKMANAGFETLEIEAYDKNNQLQSRKFSLIGYRK